MTDRTRPDSGRATGGIVEMLQARIAELEAQLSSSGFTSADMATASAQWFRDGVASVAASVGEPMFWVRLCGDGLYEGPIHNARIEEVRKQSGVWSPLYLAAPPTAQAEGWISVAERLPATYATVLLTIDGKHITTGEYIRSLSCFSWNTHDDETDDSRVTHWMPLPPPPTSAEGVEHG